MNQGNDGVGSTAQTDYVVRIASGIGAFDRPEWDALDGTLRASSSGYNPFLSFAFLSALEDSGCAVGRSGWQGQHLRLETSQGRLLGAMPCYAKSHSQGEYVFDHGWADAFERAGGQYYPKLISAAPFSPVTGPRLLVRPDVDLEDARRILLGGALAVCERYEVSSLHVNFPTQSEWDWLGDYGSSIRDQAMAYALMVRHKIEHPQRENLLPAIAERMNRHYYSTQERIALFLAARAAGGASSDAWEATLKTADGATALTSRSTELRSLDPERFKATSRWHYINAKGGGCGFELERDCPNGDCVVMAIERQRAILADRSQPLEARRDALKFLVHFLGDVHQPMHAGNRTDAGGNGHQISLRTPIQPEGPRYGGL